MTSPDARVTFRDGPTGRRAGLVAGPDVWELVRALQQAHVTEPTLPADYIAKLVADSAGLPISAVRVSMDYYADFPDEVNALIVAADRAEVLPESAWVKALGLPTQADPTRRDESRTPPSPPSWEPGVVRGWNRVSGTGRPRPSRPARGVTIGSDSEAGEPSPAGLQDGCVLPEIPPGTP